MDSCLYTCVVSGKAVTGGKATFGEAMLATLFGPIVYCCHVVRSGLLSGNVIGSSAYVIALILRFNSVDMGLQGKL